MTIGQNIARYRKMAGYTQKELAEKCNCATGTIQQYELEKRTPKIDKLSEIAKALDIPIDYLFGDMSIGLMTETDIMQLSYYFSQNDKIRGLQKLLLDNDCILTKKENNYILQKRINGTYGKRIIINDSEYNTLVNDIDKTTNFLIKFILDKVFDSHDYYFYDNPDNSEEQKQGGANTATPSDTE